MAKTMEEVLERFRTIEFHDDFDMIVAIANGGIVPAGIINQRLQKEVHLLRINLREKKEKKAAYRSLIRPELADELYDKILNIVVVQKKYKDPDYSAKDLAKELKTNTRYLSAVVNSRFGMNYSCLLNEYRVKDALHLLTDKRYADKNVEEISAMVGFANRQSFYAAFYKNVGETPNGYRKKHAESKK